MIGFAIARFTIVIIYEPSQIRKQKGIAALFLQENVRTSVRQLKNAELGT